MLRERKRTGVAFECVVHCDFRGRGLRQSRDPRATGGVADFRVLSATTALGLAALSAVDAMDRQGCTEKDRGRQGKTWDLLCW